MAQIIRSSQAQEDLLDIWTHIASDNLPAADRMLEVFEARFNMLSSNPKSGADRSELLPGMRSWAVGAYLIFFDLGSTASMSSASSTARGISMRFSKREPVPGLSNLL